MRFEHCQGRHACQDDGVNCLRCRRSLVEIAALRCLLDQLAELALEHDYENVEDYADYIARKLPKLIAHRREPQPPCPSDSESTNQEPCQ